MQNPPEISLQAQAPWTTIFVGGSIPPAVPLFFIDLFLSGDRQRRDTSIIVFLLTLRIPAIAPLSTYFRGSLDSAASILLTPLRNTPSPIGAQTGRYRTHLGRAPRGDDLREGLEYSDPASAANPTAPKHILRGTDRDGRGRRLPRRLTHPFIIFPPP